MRIHELAKELGVTNDAVIRRCTDLGIEAKSHMATVTDEDATMLKAIIHGEIKAKTTTKPWNADENPWSLDLLRIQKKRPGFHVRWTTADGLQRKIEQGWIVADRKNYGGVTDTVAGEESKNGSMIKRRELILIEISDELFQARQEFFRTKTDKRSVDAKKIATDQARQIEGMDLSVSSTVA